MAFKLTMGISLHAVRAQSFHWSGLYQFFHKYSQAQDSPSLWHRQCISSDRYFQLFIISPGVSGFENIGRWMSGCQCRWVMKRLIITRRLGSSMVYICFFVFYWFGWSFGLVIIKQDTYRGRNFCCDSLRGRCIEWILNHITYRTVRRVLGFENTFCVSR
jgi:hypothetical protein